MILAPLPIGTRVKVVAKHEPVREGVITGELRDDPRWKLVTFADDTAAHCYGDHELEAIDAYTK